MPEVRSPPRLAEYSVGMDHADTHATPLRYKRHEPEKTLLYEVLAREWDRWFAERLFPARSAAFAPLAAPSACRKPQST